MKTFCAICQRTIDLQQRKLVGEEARRESRI
jgi:hypothetical protein